MIRIALCDDNFDFLRYEQKVITDYLTSQGIQCSCKLFTSGNDLLAVDENLEEYDLFLLDYEMDGLNGFATANRIIEIYRKAKIAFSTSFYDFTREGYKYHAIRYLVKSEASFDDDLKECLDYILAYSEESTQRRYSFIEGEIIVDNSNIVYVESKGHYLFFYIKNDNKKWNTVKYTIRDSLNSYSEVFDEEFVRIHQRYLVNLRYATRICKEHMIIRIDSNNTKILPIARNRYSETADAYCRSKGIK